MPTFLGGSDVAVPVTSKNKALAYDWIRIFTSNSAMRTLATVGKQIPNTTTLASINATTAAGAVRERVEVELVRADGTELGQGRECACCRCVQAIVTGKATVAKAASAPVTR